MTPDGWPETAHEAIDMTRREIDREVTTAGMPRAIPLHRRVESRAALIWCRSKDHPVSRLVGYSCDPCWLEIHRALKGTP